MLRISQLRGSLLAGGLLLLGGLCSACGGGGGDGAGDPPAGGVALATRADVVRELGNLAAFADIDMNAPAPAALAARHAGAAATRDCEFGGQASAEETTGTHAFAHFDGTLRNVTVYREDSDDCAGDAGNGVTAIDDGYFEEGLYEPPGGGDAYTYEQFGAGGGVARLHRLEKAGDPAYPRRTAVRGLRETRLGPQQIELRSLMLRYSYEQPGHAAEHTLGDGETLRVRVPGASGGGFAIDGPVAYNSSACAGGSLRYVTLAPVTFTAAGVTAQGRIRFESAGHAATVTFNGDGGASVQFGGGDSLALSPAEVAAAFDTDPC